MNLTYIHISTWVKFILLPFVLFSWFWIFFGIGEYYSTVEIYKSYVFGAIAALFLCMYIANIFIGNLRIYTTSLHKYIYIAPLLLSSILFLFVVYGLINSLYAILKYPPAMMYESFATYPKEIILSMALSIFLLFDFLYITRSYKYGKLIVSALIILMVGYTVIFLSAPTWFSDRQTLTAIGTEYGPWREKISPRLVAKYADTGVFSSALVSAVRSKDRPTVELLLNNDVDIQVGPWGGISPLLAAMHAEDIEMMEYLLSRGANPNVGAVGQYYTDTEGNRVRDKDISPWFVSSHPSQDPDFKKHAQDLLRKYGASESQ